MRVSVMATGRWVLGQGKVPVELAIRLHMNDIAVMSFNLAMKAMLGQRALASNIHHSVSPAAFSWRRVPWDLRRGAGVVRR